MFKCIKRSKAKLQFPRGNRGCGDTDRLDHPVRDLGKTPPPRSGVQGNLGPRFFSLLPRPRLPGSAFVFSPGGGRRDPS